jgi:hypothetical protein
MLVAVLGAGLAAVGVVWHQDAIREREAELLFVGDQFRQALLSYARLTPVGQPRSPRTLSELVADTRQPKVARHLRRIYPDPMTGRLDWGLLLDGGRIKGVFSKGRGTPVKTAGFPLEYALFAKAPTYARWRFLGGEGVPASNPGTPVAGIAPSSPATGGAAVSPGAAASPGTAAGGAAGPTEMPEAPPARSACEAALDQGMDNCGRMSDIQKSLECQEPVLDAWTRCEDEARSKM